MGIAGSKFMAVRVAIKIRGGYLSCCGCVAVLGLYAGSTSAGGLPAVENAAERAALPLYRTIPAARSFELTPALLFESAAQEGWARSNADAANTRYSALSEINRSNI